jgi:prepilin-type N-terminal cleavage/methylation domain-containing protein
MVGRSGMNEKGFSVVEMVIVVAVVALVSVIVISKVFGIQSAASTVKCAANIAAFSSEIELLGIDGTIPTQEDVRNLTLWQTKYKDYWYLPNNSDFNKGHGNDLDGCDEENPGKSSKNRECIPMKFVIVCGHQTHGDNSDAKYVFKIDEMPPFIVPYEERRHTYLQDAKWWPNKDPGFDKWWGKVPKK